MKFNGSAYLRIDSKDFMEVAGGLDFLWVDMPDWVHEAGEEAVKEFDFEGFNHGYKGFLRPITPHEIEIWKGNTSEAEQAKHPVNATLVKQVMTNMRQRLFVKCTKPSKQS